MSNVLKEQTNNLVFKLSLPRKKNIDTLQFRFGGHMEGDKHEFNSELRKLFYEIRMKIWKRSRDGYFKDKFLFIYDPNVSLERTGRGIVFVDVMLYLEETYEKKFILDYLPTIFQEIQDSYEGNKFFKTKPYSDAKIEKQKRP